MKRTSFLIRVGFSLVAVFAGLLFLASSAIAQVELSVQLGFEGRLTPGHYAPIRIKVQSYQGDGTSRLRVTQPVGNEWRGNATIRQELGFAIQSSGLYESVIPVYDPVNPITVELVTSVDTVLASTTIDPRTSMRAVPYPVLDDQIPRFDDRAAVTDVGLLPTQWWAYDSAESLWLASPLSGDRWEAVSQWVLAGGSVVLLTGTDFYRMDSPALRSLIPLTDPVLAVSELGTTYLTGGVAEATSSLFSDEGFPLLIQGSYGAGHVSLVTTRAQSLSSETLTNIAEQVAPSQVISVQQFTDYILGEGKVATLSSLFALVLLVAGALAVSASAGIGRRKPKLGWAVLLVLVGGLSVWSGVSSNPTKHIVEVYAAKTHIYVETNISFYAGFFSFYSQTDSPFIQDHKAEVIPVQYLPRMLTGLDSYDLLTVPKYTETRVLPGGMRQWHAYGAASSMFDVKLTSNSTVRINNYSPLISSDGWLLIDGLVHPVGEIARGVREYSFAPGSTLRLAAFVGSLYSEEIPMSAWKLIGEIRKSFPFEKGVWLIAFADEERIASGQVTQKVREITLVAVQGKEVAGEI